MATSGDTINVAAGTYLETIDLGGKAILLRGAGAAVTTIDATGLGDSAVVCVSGEGPDTEIRGFTLRGNDGRFTDLLYRGGGMYNDGSSPTVRGCTFGGSELFVTDDSTCYEPQAGPGCNDVCCSTVVCANDPFCCDSQWDQLCADDADAACFEPCGGRSEGGGMYNTGASPTLIECTFVDNLAGDGGGMFSVGGAPRVIDCAFVSNVGDYVQPGVSKGFGSGGGMHSRDSNPTVIGTLFSTNWSSSGGGAVCRGGAPTFINCDFRANTALSNGGAWTIDTTARFINSLFVDNGAVFGSAGGLGHSDHGPGNDHVVNCLFDGNFGDFAGAIWGGPDLHIRNTIVWDSGVDAIFGGDISFCNIEGGAPGAGNIDSDPGWVDAPNGDYHLILGSPCADAGINAGVPADAEDLDGDGLTTERVPIDFDGDPRFVADKLDFDPGCGIGAIVDIGPFEHPGTPAGDVFVADVNGTQTVDVDDLIAVIVAFGPCLPDTCCLADINADGVINVDDLIAVILGWTG